jgi:Protein of unknown function (DUF2934)
MPKPKNPKKNNGIAVPAVAVEVAAVHNVVPGKVESSFTEHKTELTTAPAPVEHNATERNPLERNLDIQTAAVRKTRKPEILKTEPRSNLFPINLEDEIRRLAYLLSERRGFQPGHENEDWLSAEREVLQRYHQQSA